MTKVPKRTLNRQRLDVVSQRRVRVMVGVVIATVVGLTLAQLYPTKAQTDVGDVFRGLHQELEAAKSDFIFKYVKFKSGELEPFELAHRLSAQYARERAAVLDAFRRGLPLDQITHLVQDARIVGLGDFSVPFSGGEIFWLFQDNCVVTTETVMATGPTSLNIAMVGLGAEDLVADPAIFEKRLDLIAMEIPVGQAVTISTSSFSPLVKGIIVFAAGALLGGCSSPPPPPACTLTHGGCPGAPNSCTGTARPTCTPIRDHGLLVACRCV